MVVPIVARAGIQVRGPVEGRGRETFTSDALAFVEALEREFGAARRKLLDARRARQASIAAGGAPGFLEATRDVREGSWRVAPAPRDLEDRRVEITGPVDRKMMINALNSGARVFMADFEDAMSPTWGNVVAGQANLADAVERRIEHRSPEGKTYRLVEEPAVLVVRPRGLHLAEKHVLVGDEPVSASLFDAGLYLHHNAKRLLARGSGPYLYLPKLESHLEARLWNQVLEFAERELNLPRASIRATVLVEHILAAFEMDEILYELRERAAGLNAGRWDYLFSIVKTFREDPEVLLPDRAQLTMGTPFMRAYTDLLVATCHRRGAHAIGGMAAFVPNRRDPAATELALAKVREDKEREAAQGFDGTWVAHPDLVPVAMEVFDRALGAKPNQLANLRPDVAVEAKHLLGFHVPGGKVTEAGLRNNVSVALQYMGSWLGGTGAAAILNLMEDTATAEIARSQVWQWLRRGAALEDGRAVSQDLVARVLAEEDARLEAEGSPLVRAHLAEARALFEEVAMGPEFVEFLTIPAYARLE